ncbi:MAG TPA: transposase [Candidatus Lokiarchaeia archaeon]|nr:transposase [Candidatus Lokiarchaeia archaeon]
MERMVYRTEIHYIKKAHPLFKYCDEVCFKSKNLYNHTNYMIRQQFFYLETFLTYDGQEYSLYFQVKDHETYKALPAQTAEGILKKLEDNWHSFFESMKEWKVNPSKFLGIPRPPKYKENNGRFTTFFTNQQCKVKNGWIRFPKTNLYITTRISEPLHEVRITPEGNRYKIEIVHEHVVPEPASTMPRKIASIDLGLNNLVTLTDNIGDTPIVINGRIAKSMNQFYNKKKAKLMSFIGDKGTSNRLSKLSLKREHKISDQMHKVSRFVVDWCIDHGIDTLVVGKNDEWKQEINIGKKNNQAFVCIPFNDLVEKLVYKCEDAGIRFVETDESYTSKCSFLDRESIEHHDTYLGRRVKRGLFRSSNGTRINADVNGSYNILVKAFPEAMQLAGGDRGCALHPVRINIT